MPPAIGAPTSEVWYPTSIPTTDMTASVRICISCGRKRHEDGRATRLCQRWQHSISRFHIPPAASAPQRAFQCLQLQFHGEM